MVLVVGCGSSGQAGDSNETTQKAYAPRINPADFTTEVDNKYFPLKPGTTFVYEGNFQGAAERDEMGWRRRNSYATRPLRSPQRQRR
jgi:hypothetical protein